MIKQVYSQAERDMRKSVETVTREFGGVRTGRASTGLLDSIRVEYYGTPTPLGQVATLATPEPRLITVQPWDPTLVPAIEKAILKSDLGITPASDGKVIRLAMPPLTEQRRKELVKVVRKLAEDGRVAVRNIRRDANDRLKMLEKDKKISEDDLRKGLDQVQDLTNRVIKEIDDLLSKKEKEILEF
ncbi:MAG: ribosome recycling factor [candidate division NC10 bacterium]|nr:ribosome recycling factor [candidate division NC10 bacterium]